MKVTITIDPALGVTYKDVARTIEYSLLAGKEVRVTVTPDTIDVQKGVEFSDVKIFGEPFKQLEKIAKDLDVPIEQVIRRGLERIKKQKEDEPING